MSYTIFSVAAKIGDYLRQIYLEIMNEHCTHDAFWQAICVPFLEDVTEAEDREALSTNGTPIFAYDLM